jgi:hypothetical protein
VRGSPVTAGAVTMLAYGIGGDGGNGATQGVGGFGAGGSLTLLASKRFQRTERGSANVSSLQMTSLAFGGGGSTAGATYYGDFGGLDVSQSDVTLGTFSYSNQGDLAPTYDITTDNGDGTTTTAPNVPTPAKLSLIDSHVTAGSIDMSTPGALIVNLDNSTLDVGNLFLSAGSFLLPAVAPANPGTINVTDGLQIGVGEGGTFQTYAQFNTDFGVSFTFDGDFSTGSFSSAGDISIESLNGSVTTGSLSGATISLVAATDVTAGSLTGETAVNVSAGGNATTGTLTGGFVGVSAGQNATLGPIVGDTVNVGAGANVQTGTISGQTVTVSAGQSITTGALTGGTIDLDAAQNVAAGPISADFVSLVGGQNVTASNISATSGIGVEAGLATVNGQWTAPSIQVLSNDIAIAATGSVSGNTVSLISSNANGAFIGDGLSGSGYGLSNAEFGRVSGQGILIASIDNPSNAVDMTIGNLAITGQQLGSTGYVDFATGTLDSSGVAPTELDGATASGRIRIDGTISATGLTPENYLEFFADSIELNADTGGIFASGSQGELGGIVLFDANNIHIASDDILLRLREDLHYAGLADDLNRAGNVNRPEGVVSALGLVFYPGETLYVQNTGSATTPAGFYTTIDDSDIEPPGFSDPNAPDVDVIINGQFQGPDGDVTGSDALALIAANAESLDGFSDASQVNGCAVGTGSCVVLQPVEETPPPVSSAEIEVLTQDQAQEEPFDTTDDSDDDKDQAEQDAQAPIAPPVVLINTRPLNPDVDVEDPVSGSGNPALINAGVGENPQGDQP